MATSAWLLLLFLSVVLLKESFCKECTNIPSSSHTIRQALLSSPNLSSSLISQFAESFYTYPHQNSHGASQAAENPLSYTEHMEPFRKDYGSYDAPLPNRESTELSHFPLTKKGALISAENPSPKRELLGFMQFNKVSREAMDFATNPHVYRESVKFDEVPHANIESMESSKYSQASRKFMRSDMLVDKGAMEYDEGMASNEPFLQEVSLHDVYLDPDSMQGKAQQTNLEYLLMLDVDSLVWSFRNVSNLRASGSPYGGWELPTSELRGHFVGHYLSATAQMWASTHNDTLYEKMTAVVDALSECQQKIGSGYLSAFPSEFFDRFEAIQSVWAPYYTIHKYTFAGNNKTLRMAMGMADYFNQRVLRVIDLYTIERHWESLNEETGGMNDVLYRLYTLTDDSRYLKLAHLFDKPCFLGLLALQADSLSGFHANTHIPIVIGAQMRFEITGEELYKDMSSFFMDIISTSHSYPTGGTSASEFWTDPLHLGDTLFTTETEESCTTYNMLKVARHLFRWTKQMVYADYYERALTNGVLSIQRGQEPGVMIYMLPMGKGKSKAISYHGWGTKFQSFWCCYGTGIESFSKLGDSIYFEEIGASIAFLYIIQLVSSSLAWHSTGLLLHQKVEEFSSSNPILHASFEFSEINNTIRGPNTDTGTLATLQIRIPFWANSSSGRVLLNNETLDSPIDSGAFLGVTRTWQAGDKLDLFLHTLLRLEKVKDSRDSYGSLHAIFYGPYLLAGVSDGDWDIMGVDSQSLSTWVTPVEDVAKEMLYSFSQEHTSMQDAVFLTHEHSSLTMRKCPLEGTNEATYSTFKLVDPVAGNLLSESCLNTLLKGMVRIVNEPVMLESGFYRNELIGKLVAIGLFDEPGSYLMHSDSRRVEILRAHMQQNDGQGCGHGNVAFQIVPGLHSRQEYVSFEALSKPGCFLYTDYNAFTTVRLGCMALDGNVQFRKAASFLIHQPLASYHSMSFIAKGTNKHYLLSPLIAFKDETYTVFFNITS